MGPLEPSARWRSGGMLFSTAVLSDYMLPLSAQIQAEALRQAAAWPRALSHLRLSINVTAEDIAQPGLMPQFLNLVDMSGFPRSRLTVEITESGLIEDVDNATALLAAQRAENGRAHVGTPVTNAPLVRSRLLEKKQRPDV